MTNFLNRLAGRTLGVIPLVEPLLSARFDPTVGKSDRQNLAVSHLATSAEWDLAAIQEAVYPYENEYSSRLARLKTPASPDAIQPAASHLPLRAEVRSSRPEPENEEAYATPPHGQRQHAADVNPQPLPTSRAVRPEVFGPESQFNQHGAFGNRMDDAMAGPVHNKTHSPVSRQSSPSASPVVRVTIGRIDVRAELTSSPVPATRRPRSSIVSLEQFLKQRSEAGQ